MVGVFVLFWFVLFFLVVVVVVVGGVFKTAIRFRHNY